MTYKISRRQFLELGATGVAAGLLAQLNWPAVTAYASVQTPQTPLPGASIPKYVEPLPVFGPASGGTLPRVNKALIRVSAEEFQQKVLPASFYAGLPDPYSAGTYVWGYRVDDRPPLYPGVTVQALRRVPTVMQYVNNLPLAPVLHSYITVDQSIHWANPLGLDMMDPNRMLPYAGPPPMVAHLHGAEVSSRYDGGPDQWFTPNGIHGSSYQTLSRTPSNSSIYLYPNTQEATTLWFHDHTLGATRLNVYAGLAAFYLLRDEFDTGLPGLGLNLPAGPYEIEIAIQDRQFDTNGQWFFPDGYPDAGLNGPPPNPDVHPFWNPEFFGDAIVVNGKTWPYLEVEPRRYRFRFLDGSNARFYNLSLELGLPFWQIGTDGGLLDKPAPVTQLFMAPGERADVIIDFSAVAGQTIHMTNDAAGPFPTGSPVDPATNAQIMQFRVKPKLSGLRDMSFDPAAAGATLRGGSRKRPPAIVRLADPTTGTVASGVVVAQKRQLTLKEDEGAGGPLQVLVNNTKWTGRRGDMGDPIPGFTPDGHGNWLSELPKVGSTEVWEIINLTMDAHPIHLHLVQFQLLNRQAFDAMTYEMDWGMDFPGGAIIPAYGPPLDYFTPNADGALGGNRAVTPYLQGPVMLPDPNEAGWKDTIKMYPGQVARIAVRWAPQHLAVNGVSAGQNKYVFDPTQGPGYVWHCHIVDHEDNEMMRPYHPVA